MSELAQSAVLVVEERVVEIQQDGPDRARGKLTRTHPVIVACGPRGRPCGEV